MATKDTKNAACASARPVYDYINEVNTEDSAFTGFSKLKDSFGNLAGQINQVNTLGPNFDNFIAANLPSSTSPAVTSIQTFIQSFSKKSTPNGSG